MWRSEACQTKRVRVGVCLRAQREGQSVREPVTEEASFVTPEELQHLEGIEATHKSLVEKVVIVPCDDSPCNTHIFPVRKTDGTWQFVQDLRAVNTGVIPWAPIFKSCYYTNTVPNRVMFFLGCRFSKCIFPCFRGQEAS